MGMVVRSNIMAQNANRMLGMNNSKVGNSLEKLASGFRINRAGDDASGLAISEKMKAQIKGLETASANSQDGISLVQTAEGALTEVHDMLNRMVELAGKSANGTMDDNVDRAALEKELTSLKEEINRIAEGTNFNGIMLLDGTLGIGKAGKAEVTAPEASGFNDDATAATGTLAGFDAALLATITNGQFVEFGGQTYEKGTNAGQWSNFTELAALITADASSDWNVSYNAGTETMELTAKTKGQMGSEGPGTPSAFTYGATGNENNIGTPGTVDGSDRTAKAATNAVTTVDFTGMTGKDVIGSVYDIGGTKYEFVKTAGEGLDTDATEIVIGEDATASDIVDAFVAKGNLTNADDTYVVSGGGTPILTYTSTKDGDDPTAKAMGTAVTGGKGLILQVGDTADDYNKVSVKIGNMSTEGLGIDDISVADQDSASAALKLLKNTDGSNFYGAINIVSSTRADLGALQNKLEHTINNLDVAAENMSAANSRIRDTDMAKEIMEYTKMNVLTQAAQAMLAQANQQPQSVLQLLQ